VWRDGRVQAAVNAAPPQGDSTLKPCPHSGTLSQKSATVAENGEIRRLSHFSATVWMGFKWPRYNAVLN